MEIILAASIPHEGGTTMNNFIFFYNSDMSLSQSIFEVILKPCSNYTFRRHKKIEFKYLKW